MNTLLIALGCIIISIVLVGLWLYSLTRNRDDDKYSKGI